MRRTRELGILSIITIVLIIMGCTGPFHSNHQKTLKHSAYLRIIYPREPRTLHTSVEEIDNMANSVSYLQSGNLTVNYHPDGSISGEYNFSIKNIHHNLTLYLATIGIPDALKLNVSLNGNNIELNRLDKYIIRNNTLGLRAKVYVINVSTSLPEIKGMIKYQLNDSFVRTLNPSLTIGTPLTWWAISGKGNLVNLTVRFPSGYIFFLPGYGLLNSTIKMKNFNINRIYGAFFMRVGKVQEISAGSMHAKIYIPANCQYTHQSLENFEEKLQVALTLYSNVTKIVPVNIFYIILNPSWPMDEGLTTTDTTVPSVVIGCFSSHQLPSVGNVVYSNPGLIFHELGHLWFGDYAKFGRIDESLATFMEFLAMSKTDKQYSNYLDDLDDIENLDVLPNLKSMSLIYAYKEGILNPTIREAIIYYKGAFVFRSLQFVLGNETFFKGLRELLKECHGKECNLTDIQNVFEKVSGQNLDWFFNEWFYTTKVPDYYVRNLSLNRKNGKYLLTFEITDENNFTMPLDVEVKTQTKSFVKRVWVNGTARVEFELNDKPRIIILDPDEWMVNENRVYPLKGVEIIIN
ncbi:M1 family aminopeptidase [Thermococcus sp.]|uniref:M1 family aminopeptidase n=1 Tax=Thermococcus sp. TaxID=35749 RepID=UPI00262554C3|nr:M1 family aminopeptidase [Thermococcus sp.]